MNHDGHGNDRPDGHKVTCRTCRAELGREGSHLRVAFGQVQVCHGAAGYFRLEVNAGQVESRPQRRRRRRAA